jgi:hypothetical protein
LNNLLEGTIIAVALITIVYGLTGFRKILDCYKLFFTREYWKPYNIVEALSWATKAIIIVPGLVFGIEIWYFYFLTLFTSLTLIWASNEKLLPTLVGFNTLWTWISCAVLAKHLF